MLFSLFMAGMLAQQPAQNVPPRDTPAQPEQAVSANLKLRIGTSTYLPDGRVLTTSASDWPLAINKPVTAYAAVGKNMCEPKAATLEQPATMPVPGWQVEFTPVREAAGELEVRVQWRQLGLASKQTFNRMRFGATTTLKLHAGDRIVVDYIASLPGPGLFLDGYRVELKNATGSITPKTGANDPSLSYWLANRRIDPGDCNAVGMSLDIGLEPAKTEAIVEAELWLVRPNRDGTELSERQVLRLPIGQPASRYYFDEARLTPAKPGGTYAKVSGELGAFAVENGKIHFNFKVARRYEGSPSDADATSTYRDLVATPGEVVAFQLPTTAAPLSVRLRAQVLR
jgi:hypothetical protein